VEKRIYISAAVVFALAAGLTLSSARMMAAAMPMPGGWTMAMAWMRMPGESWFGAGATFVTMWLTMMITMMLPSTLPMLLLYRRVVHFRGEAHPAVLVWSMAAAYFLVWTLFGLAAYAVGVTVAQASMRSEAVSRAVPVAAGAALIAAGLYQLTPWKHICLKHCRDPLGVVAQHLRPGGWRGALRLGTRHGLFCTGCCWALMVMQLVVGVMNLGAMVGLAAVIALEKLTRRGELLARVVGMAAVLAGGFYVLRAVHG
jgi:predicted metal-binding membrane protein